MKFLKLKHFENFGRNFSFNIWSGIEISNIKEVKQMHQPQGSVKT